jgi:AcrR family transcriptional regulator
MTTPRGRIPDADRPERRGLILDAAVELFLADGYASTSIDAVASRCSASKSTVYAYFTDKAGLFTAAVERLHNTIDDSVDDDAPLAAVAAAMVTNLLSDEAIGLHRLIIGESQRFGALARAFYAAGPQRSIERLLASLRRSEPQAPTADAERLYSLLLGERHRRRLLGLEHAPTSAQAADHADSVLRALGHV